MVPVSVVDDARSFGVVLYRFSYSVGVYAGRNFFDGGIAAEKNRVLLAGISALVFSGCFYVAQL